jgi:hypothetical protein
MDVNEPFAKEKATTPNNMIMAQKTLSVLLVPEISP